MSKVSTNNVELKSKQRIILDGIDKFTEENSLEKQRNYWEKEFKKQGYNLKDIDKVIDYLTNSKLIFFTKGRWLRI